MKNIILTNEQREKLQNLQIFSYSYEEKNGKPVLNDAPFKMLSFPEIFEEMKKIILSETEFTSIKRASPLWANCIIRVFSTTNYAYSDNLIYNIYGASCYTRVICGWQTKWQNGEKIPLDYREFQTRTWLCQDEYIDFDHDFVDYYVHLN